MKYHSTDKVFINSVRYENYGSEESPHWKHKGTFKFVLEMDTDEMYWSLKLHKRIFAEICKRCSNAHERFEYLDYSVEIQRPYNVTDMYDDVYNDIWEDDIQLYKKRKDIANQK